jgi:hypothetical protein
MGHLRSFAESDIPNVAEMYARILLRENTPCREDLCSYFREVFFRNPWGKEDLSSLVYQENGSITGFLGILPRRMSANGQSILAAISLHLMVEPGSRSRLVGVELLRALFRGPQDLTFTDTAGELGQRFWEGMGGNTALPYSLYWARPLRPARYAISLLGRRRPFGAIAFATKPLCSLADALVTRIPRSRLGIVPQEPEEDLSVETILNHINDFAGKECLRPDYNAPELEWLLSRASQRKGSGKFRKVVIRNSKQEVIGWYLYYLNPGGTSPVLQVAGTKDSIKQVLDHLFYHSWRGGAVALSGRLDPRFVQQFSDKYCLFDRRGPWTLVHSRRVDLIQAIQRGNAFLTTLEGEWCLDP